MSRSSTNHVDPLFDVLATLGTRSIRRTRLEAAGDWALAFPALARLKFVAVLRGKCWLLLPDQPAHLLVAGDTYLLGDISHVVASDPAIPAIDGMALYEAPNGDLVRLGGEETVMLGGGMTFMNERTRFLIDTLPSFMLIPASSPSAAAVAKTLALLDGEVGQSRLGGTVMTERLADVLLVEAIRSYVADHGVESAGWIGALADRRIGDALRLIHGDVAHRWTVGRLATQVGMSRSAFSSRFNQLVGRPPLDYVRYWRMVLAQHALSEATANIPAIAARLGYASQSGFGQAYKRTFGLSPRRHKSRD